MLIIDAHLDLAWNAVMWNRDLRLSAYTLRTQEVRVQGKGRAQNTVSLPHLCEGRVAVAVVTLLARSTGKSIPHLDYASPEQAYASAQGQLAYYHALQAAGDVRILTDGAAVRDHLAVWAAWESGGAVPANCPPLGVVISMEGADPILTPGQIDAWHAGGLRALGLAHYGYGRYAGGTATETGLTALGRALLPEVERLGMILDLTHLSDAAFWESIDAFGGTVIASHQNCRALVPHQRQFSDDQLRAVIARDGVIGTALDVWMLKPDWNADRTSNAGITLETAADHLDHVCQIAGNARHAAIGSDLDGGFGRDQSPVDLDTIADLQKLVGILERRGWSPDDIGAAMHGNWARVLMRL
ncbi:MAG: membrane dipeptidase [bacterium]|nr:membrane dipeptidase [bacterium]